MPTNQAKHQLNNKFWNFVKNPDGTAELMLYGPISSSQSWFEDVITPQQFAQDLVNLGNVNQITVCVNSGGGDPLAANAILTQLKVHPAEIIVRNDGLMASAAALFLAAGKVITPDYAQTMIHNVKVLPNNPVDADGLQKLIAAVTSIKEGFINAMVAKTGLDRDVISKMMDAETWMTGDIAVEKGFADELMFVEPGKEDPATMSGDYLFINQVKHDLSRFKTRPTIPAKQDVVITTNTEEVKPDMDIKTSMDLKTQLPDIHNEILAAGVSTGKTEGAAAERARLQKFDALNGKVDPEFLAAEKYKDGATAESVLYAATLAGKTINAGYVAAATVDAATANGIPGVASDTAVQTTAQATAAEVPAVLNFVQTIAKKAFNL
jgi:ATP-dependent Clp protease, protease subunit